MFCCININSLEFLHLLMIAGLIGVSASDTMLSIPNDNWQLECHSSVVLTCTLPTVPQIAMTWRLNGNTAAVCYPKTCDPPTGLPNHYTTTVGNGTEYYLSIDPIKLTDNYTISCLGVSESKSFNTTVKVPVKPSEFNVSKDVQSDKTIVTILSNCIFAPKENITFKLQYQKGPNENITYTHVNPSEVIDCSYVDNPDCGGNSTGRAKADITIQTAQTNTSYLFQLVVFQSNIELTPVIDIGMYTIPDQTATNWVLISSCSAGGALGVGLFVAGICCTIKRKKPEMKIRDIALKKMSKIMITKPNASVQ